MSRNGVTMPWCDGADRNRYGRCVACGFRSAKREGPTPRHRMRAYPCLTRGEGHACRKPSSLHQHECECGATLQGLAIRGVGWSRPHGEVS